MASLALASAWRARLVLDDRRQIRRADAGQRVYRPGLGWTNANQLDSRRRWARAGSVAAAGLMLALLGLASGVIGSAPAAIAMVLACTAIIVWMFRDRGLHHARYTSVCIATLAFAVVLDQAAVLVRGNAPDALTAARPRAPATTLAGIFASVFASQLYLVAGIRKLRSAHFMTGRVLIDNLAYGTFQAAGGNRDFIMILRPQRLADLLHRRAFLSGCRFAAILTVLIEFTIGLGAIGLLPVIMTFGLAIPTHLAFLLLSPRRVMPFTVAALGLLALATAHPLLRAIT